MNIKAIVIAAITVVLSSTLVLAAPPDPNGHPDNGQQAPPCHGQNNNDCRSDPQPDYGQDCYHSDDHVCRLTPIIVIVISTPAPESTNTPAPEMTNTEVVQPVNAPAVEVVPDIVVQSVAPVLIPTVRSGEIIVSSAPVGVPVVLPSAGDVPAVLGVLATLGGLIALVGGLIFRWK